jgi:transposase
MTKPFSVAFKQKMVQRLTGKDATSATQLARETGVHQQNLSRWLQEAHSLPLMADHPKPVHMWTIEQKVRVLAGASQLDGEELATYLAREGVKRAEYEQWRLALDEGGAASTSTSKRIRQLERELDRKEKALAEAAALLVLKKKWTPCMGRTRTTTPTGRTRGDPRSCRPGVGVRRVSGTCLRCARDLGSNRRALACGSPSRRSPLWRYASRCGSSSGRHPGDRSAVRNCDYDNRHIVFGYENAHDAREGPGQDRRLLSRGLPW